MFVTLICTSFIQYCQFDISELVEKNIFISFQYLQVRFPEIFSYLFFHCLSFSLGKYFSVWWKKKERKRKEPDFSHKYAGRWITNFEEEYNFCELILPDWLLKNVFEYFSKLHKLICIFSGEYNVILFGNYLWTASDKIRLHCNMSNNVTSIGLLFYFLFYFLFWKLFIEIADIQSIPRKVLINTRIQSIYINWCT